ncbi:MAG: Ku protein, partial [Proteobacteria bacterium]|nr:Ku protein [Pseudomonadota bacterium]
LRPTRRGLVLQGLHYADEVRSFDEIDMGDQAEPSANELALADQLIAQLTGETFDPTQYEDEYRQAVLAAVERKVAGEEIVALTQEPARDQIIDLVAALKQSLSETPDAAKPRDRKPAKAKGKPRKKAAAKKAGTRKKSASR